MATPPTTDQVFATLRSFEEEYHAAIREGKNLNDLITSKPSEERFGGKHVAFPSAELYACNKLLWLVRSGPGAFKVEQMDDIKTLRVAVHGAFEVLAGRCVVKPKPVDVHGVQAYWVAWPGIDTREDAPTVLYFHGGGMAFGDALYLYGFLDRLSRISGCRVLTIEYRLAPENSPMDAVADGVTAYRYLIEDLKVPSKNIFLVGESGGGQMVLLVAQAIAKKQLSGPAAAWALSPVCTADDEDHHIYRDPAFDRNCDHMFPDAKFNLKIEQLLRQELDGKDARVSPLYGSFQNVCPLYFTVSDTELYVNEGIATEKVAREAKVVTSLVVEPHGPHAHPALNTPEGIADTALAFAWMKQFSIVK